MQEQLKVITGHLNDVNNIEMLSDQINQATILLKNYNETYSSNENFAYEEEIKMLEVRYQSIQTALSTINVEHKEDMKDFKLKLDDLYNSMSNLFRLQHTKITKLESDMENLRKQMKLQEKSKLIGDLLIPLASISSI
jgi:hypothetical protein